MKTYLVSGGASGLGKATCELLFSQGNNIACLDRDDGSDFVKELNASAKQVGIPEAERRRMCVLGVC